MRFLLFLLNSAITIYGGTVSENFSQFERIVENYDDILLGAPIDYRYNESTSSNSAIRIGLPSVPGCPRSIDGQPWLYYGNPPKCHLSGLQFPCSFGRKLFPQIGSPYGICGCQCLEDLFDYNFDWGKMHFCKAVSNLGKEKEYVFEPERKMCYQLKYDQGPCKNNEWVVKDESRNDSTSGGITLRCEQCAKELVSYHNCPFEPVSVAGVSNVSPNSCKAGWTYSKILRTCVKQNSGHHVG